MARSASSVAVDEAPLVALIGPPNSGKTTLFNQLTGLRQKVANYPGVTVEKHIGQVRTGDHDHVDLVDLPGVHGFSARSLDEQVTRDVLEGRIEGVRAPDALILIVDATRLESQLMLVEPVLEMELSTLLVLNMSDELEARGGRVDDAELAERLGVEVVRTSARTGAGVDAVRAFMARVTAADPGEVRERTLTNVPRGVALPMVDAFTARRAHVREVVSAADFVPPGPSGLSDRLDSIFLHRFGGPLVFMAVVVLVFQSIFTWAVPLMDGVDWMIGSSGDWLSTNMSDTWFRSLLVDGRMGRRRLRRDLPPADPHPFLLHRDPRGLRIHGPSRGHRRPNDVSGRAAGPRLPAAPFRLRMRGAGDPRGENGRRRA